MKVSKQNEWDVIIQGKSYFFSQTFTFAGSTTTINLDLPKSMAINRINRIWNDTTSKDAYVRLYSPGTNYYSELDNQPSNTALSRLLYFDNLKSPIGSRYQFFFENYTGGKICTIEIQGDEL